VSGQEWDSKTAREKVFGLVDDHIGEYWNLVSDEAVAAEANRLVDAYRDELLAPVIQALRDIDWQQKETDWSGGAEIAWYYGRDSIEDALGLERGALDTGEYDEGDRL